MGAISFFKGDLLGGVGVELGVRSKVSPTLGVFRFISQVIEVY